MRTYLRSLAAILVLMSLAGGLNGCKRKGGGNSAASSANYAAERAGFKTTLTRRGPSPQPYIPDERPPEGVREVTYPSGDLRLKAWISAPPENGKRKPAVVYLHGGFAFGAEDWDETRPYADAGFVVMVPMLRGENGNPGNHEMFFGEVDDAIAAGRYAAALPYVDPRRVFLAGHSSGGAETILAALLPSPFAAATPIGGYVDMDHLLPYMHENRVIPFRESDPQEVRLRSAKHFANSLQCPVYFLCGNRDPLAQHGVNDFVADARRAGKECAVYVLPGDHNSSKPAAIQKSAELFQSKLK